MPVVHPFDLSDRRALVTGAGGGLGFAIAKALLSRDGMTAHVLAFDVPDATAVNDAIEDIERRIGPLDIVVNNAAMHRRQPLADVSDAHWRELMAANLDAPFL